MKINYVLDNDNRITGYRMIPFFESEPYIEVPSETAVHLNISQVINGEFVANDAEYEAKQAVIHARNDILYEISQIKSNLSKTDYQAIKFAEGQLTAEEFASIRAQRQEWRDRINELENQLKEAK